MYSLIDQLLNALQLLGRAVSQHLPEAIKEIIGLIIRGFHQIQKHTVAVDLVGHPFLAPLARPTIGLVTEDFLVIE